LVKHLFTVVVLTFIVFLSREQTFSAGQTESSATQAGGRQIYVPNELIVKTQPDMSASEFASINKAKGATVIERSSISGLYRLKITGPVENAISYQSNPAVEFAKPNYIFAEMDENYITLYDLESTILRFVPMLRQRYTNPQLKEDLLNNLLKDKLYSRAARDENLQSIPEVQKEIDEAVERTLARIYEKRIQTPTDSTSEKEILLYYQKNIDRYKTPEQIRGRNILVKNKAEAEELLKLLKDGADFGKLAMERSISPTGKRGGTFEWVGKGRMSPALEKAAFALEKGKVSEAIATPSGYVLIKVEEKKVSRQLPFSEVKDKVKNHLTSDKQKNAVEKKIKELKEKYHVKLHPEFLSEVPVSVGEKFDPTKDPDSVKMLQEFLKKAIERPY
jgi:peptidyl-prolyl cis-trans isomerase C